MWKTPKAGLVVALLVAAALFSLRACGEQKLGGLTAREAFPTGKVGVLVEAAIKGDFEKVDALVKAGVDVNAHGAQGITPLMWLLGTHKFKAAEHLLQLGADPNEAMEKGYSAMSVAAGGKYPKLLELLLKHGGDPNLKGPDGDPLLNIATLHQKDEQIHILINHGADVNYHSYGNTVGDVAAAVSRFDLVAYFLEHGLTYDLQSLAKGVEMVQVPANSEAQQWKDKVIEMLKARGVTNL